jgi:hypothetical protein
MSQNNNYQQIQELVSSFPSLRTQEKDLVCHDCGGISTTKIQQLLSTLEGFNTNKIKSKNAQQKKKVSARNNSQKTSLKQKKKKIIRKKIPNLTKQRKLNIKKIRSARNNNNKLPLKSKSKKQTKIK